MDLDHLFRKRDKQLFCYIVHLERTQYQWKTVPYIVPQHINYLHFKFGYFSGIGYGYRKRFSVLLLSHFPDDNGYFDASAQFHVWFCKVHNHIQLLFDHVATIAIEVICVFSRILHSIMTLDVPKRLPDCYCEKIQLQVFFHFLSKISQICI